MLGFFKEMRILPPFPQGPQTFVARQLKCIRCREIFTIAEDRPSQPMQPGDQDRDVWQSPHDQYPITAFRFEENRARVGILPEIRSEPIQASSEEKREEYYHINCPRCGADNRNWLYVSENIKPHRAQNVLIGVILLAVLEALSIGYLAFPLVTSWSKNVIGLQLAIICLALVGSLPLLIVLIKQPQFGSFLLAALGVISIGYVVFLLATGLKIGDLDLILAIGCLAIAGSLPLLIVLREWPQIGGIVLILFGAFSILFLALTSANGRNISVLDLVLAIVCLMLAGSLPLIIVPKLWSKVRDYQLTRNFLPMLPEPEAPPILLTVILLYFAFVLAIPGIKFGMIPIACYVVPICDQTSEGQDRVAQMQVDERLELWGRLLYSGTLISLVSSIFAVLAVNEIVSTVNRHLPNPIYANTSNMVRVALWEAKRALEIKNFFHEIQWTLTERNDLGGIDMKGYYQEPPEIMSNGWFNKEVPTQIYSLKTDRWCVIVNAHIIDKMERRLTGSVYYAGPASKYYAVPAPKDEKEPVVVMSIGRDRR